LDIFHEGSKELICCFWWDKLRNRKSITTSAEGLVLVRKSVITPTQKLFRAVPNPNVQNDVGRNHLEGNLWFRSHKWFRKIDGGDKMEGVGSHEEIGRNVMNRDVFDEYPGQPAFFMSFSETVEGARAFGRCSEKHRLLEVQNPKVLRDEIRKALLNTEFVEVGWLKMEYGKTMEVDHELDLIEASQRKYCQKPEKYRIEREWRLQIFFCHSFRTINDTLKFRWGNIGKLFKYSREK